MRRLFPLGLLLWLVLAVPSEAKEILSATVCGGNGCATSRDRGLIAGLAEGGDPVDPPRAAAPFFRVRLTIADEQGKAMDRFWTHFMPKGELIRGADGTWMAATAGYGWRRDRGDGRRTGWRRGARSRGPPAGRGPPSRTPGRPPQRHLSGPRRYALELPAGKAAQR